MRRWVLFAAGWLVSLTALQAVPVDCTTLSTLNEYVAASDGCFVQDKLFTNFTYTGGGVVAASNVDVDPVFSALPGQDIHGFVFTTAQPVGVWTSGFTVGYTISVDPAVNALAQIVTGKTQGNFGNVPPNPAVATTTLSNGVVQNVTLSTESAVNGFAPTGSLGVSSTANIPTGGFLISLEHTFTQVFIPEPATILLTGAGLLVAAWLARKRRPVAR